MAVRPIFRPRQKQFGVEVLDIEFVWFPGMSTSQKQRSIESLHAAAITRGMGRVLEVSSKSPDRIGRELSAFLLHYQPADGAAIPVECVYQASKVFERGGPYRDLLGVSPREAKQDPRLRASGALVEFLVEDWRLALEPTGLCYQWIYLRALRGRPDLHRVIEEFEAFTDIEFNPLKSINCQAEAVASFASLRANQLLDCALSSPEGLAEMLRSVSPARSDKLF